MSDLRFTSSLVVTVVSCTPEVVIARVRAPMFVWGAHPPVYVLDGEIGPTFYLDDEPTLFPRLDWLYRGAVEAAAEESWTICAELADAGVDPLRINHLLPSNLMREGTVVMSVEELRDAIAALSGHPLREVGMIAEGYSRLLAEQSQMTESEPHEPC